MTACETTASNRANNLTDQSWYNPLDVAKGHRGFVDGDFIMVLYAWSPNWKLNTRDKDRYELYVRRSTSPAFCRRRRNASARWWWNWRRPWRRNRCALAACSRNCYRVGYA
ncbi:MAG TPA: hypothetical protein VKA76_00210 [Gammaproteobacteria bacterium]|nr:hypothetical protein [Gammaproteobacteria bacterium]